MSELTEELLDREDYHEARDQLADAIRGAIGHNQPPELTPFEAIKAHLEDLLTEVPNWADGVPIETQAQADEVDRLADDLRDGAKAAEAARVKEKTPFDEQIAAIQDRYNEYIAPATNKHPGKVTKALKALQATQAVWRKKLADEKAAEAKRLQDIADEKAKAAQEALRAADPTNLEAAEAAEELIAEATQVQRMANRAQKSATTGTGLTTVWTAEITDLKAACGFFWGLDKEAFRPLIQQLATAHVKIHKADCAGITAHKDARAN